uniref:Protein kinase domain protein n=1 Tax=Mimiviridae sp. ChoanoV1 TaxID=2596887 RepID=A0A5B8IJ04_9VIRU|nr:protein kinase domain protein [Mimiviridae sp. ChoanoV1]
MTKKKLNKKNCKKRLNKISYKKKHYGGANSPPIPEDLEISVKNVLNIYQFDNIEMTRGTVELKLDTNNINCILRFSKSKLVLSYVDKTTNTKKHEIIKTTNDLQTKLNNLNIINIFYYININIRPPLQFKENYNYLKLKVEDSGTLLNTNDKDEYILRHSSTGKKYIIYKIESGIQETEITSNEDLIKILSDNLNLKEKKYSLKFISVKDFLISFIPLTTPDFMVQLPIEAELSNYFTKQGEIHTEEYGEVYDIILGKSLKETIEKKKKYVVKEFLDGDGYEKSIKYEIYILSRIKQIENHTSFSPEIFKCIYVKDTKKYYLIMEKLDINLDVYAKSISETKFIGTKTAYRKPPEKTLFKNCLIPLLELFNTLHKNNIVHRNVKPQNIMVTKDKKFKIIDFGLSYIKGDEIEHFFEEGILPYSNTKYYSSPIKNREHSVENFFQEILKTDEYSLSIVLYETLVASFNPTIFIYSKNFNLSFYLNFMIESQEKEYIDTYQSYKAELNFKEDSEINDPKFNYKNLKKMIEIVKNAVKRPYGGKIGSAITSFGLKYNEYSKRQEYFQSNEFEILERFIKTNLNPDTDFKDRISIEQILTDLKSITISPHRGTIPPLRGGFKKKTKRKNSKRKNKKFTKSKTSK